MTDDELLSHLSHDHYPDIINEIFNRYSHIMYGICFKYLRDTEESKDAVLTIFERIFTDLSNHTVRNLKSWLLVVAKNHCLMHLRKREIETRTLTPETYSPILLQLYEDEQKWKLDEESTNQKITQMLTGMDQLTSQQSICLTLMYLDNKSYKEIAEITGFSLKEVKSHIQNGKRNLKKILTSNDES